MRGGAEFGTPASFVGGDPCQI